MNFYFIVFFILIFLKIIVASDLFKEFKYVM